MLKASLIFLSIWRFIVVDLGKNPNTELYLLTKKQEEFLMSTNISDPLFTNDYRYIFIKELFFPEDSNCPIDDSLFLLFIFETVNMLLHLFNPDCLINIENKEDNLNNVNKHYKGGFKNNVKEFFVSYAVNPLQKKIVKKFVITDIEDLNINIAYKIAFNYKTKVNSFNRTYNIVNFNDLLGNLSIIYDWFIDVMPSEFS